VGGCAKNCFDEECNAGMLDERVDAQGSVLMMKNVMLD